MKRSWDATYLDGYNKHIVSEAKIYKMHKYKMYLCLSFNRSYVKGTFRYLQTIEHVKIAHLPIKHLLNK